MSLSATGRTWEEASSPAAVHLARRFEAAWRDAADGNGNGRGRGRLRDYPDPDDFLPAGARASSGARLALLRADLALRWEEGQRVGADWYRRRYSDLGDETLVALIYEEFCLREEHEETPDPADYLARFPEVAAQLRRVLEIHGLVGSSPCATGSLPDGSPAPAVVFPEARQTIAGFHLVEELGRGSFARVFLAQERQLADRLVALKVARAGSREPQTLARLQHTHIVPVHSSRTDPATGLHLLCMPYFGRLTLARVLADPQVQTARHGSELVAALDQLEASKGPRQPGAAGRDALARRSFARAIAWWGARMAEALDHAHDRGVLHRDIKPSNVLVTGDGMPMLLDFNLAREPLATLDDARDAPAALGTLDYMAPEHLEALGDGLSERLDGRSDIYSLGVLLFEAVAGSRPFATPRSAASAVDLLSRAAAQRRRGPPPLRAAERETPVALEVVVHRCLAPDPIDRYATAGELAADLQAVADDQPLTFAREPWPGRAARWLRRRRRPLAAAALVVAALTVAALALHRTELERVRRRAEVMVAFKKLFDGGMTSADRDEYAKAMVQFESAARLVGGDPDLADLHLQARAKFKLAEETGAIRAAAEDLFRAARPLRFRLIHLCGSLPGASTELRKVLGPFYVLEHVNWKARSELTLLDSPTRERLVREVDELLFLWLVALDRQCDPPRPEAAETMRRALEYCELAMVAAQPLEPWVALRARLAAWPDCDRDRDRDRDRNRAAGQAESLPRIAAETSAAACFQWGLLRARQGLRATAIHWFRQAARLEPSSYWYQFYLAYILDEMPRDTGPHQADEARWYAEVAPAIRYDTAVALEPDAPWVRYCRARLYHRSNSWELALADLRRALKDFDALPPEQRDADFRRKVQLEFGLIHRALGDIAAARDDYARVIEANPTDRLARAARTNRARIDVDLGALDRAGAAYDGLLEEDPDDGTARFGRGMLALQRGRAADAEADLTAALEHHPGPGLGQVADLRANRAVARLLLGRAAEAEADAAAAYRAWPGPTNQRLWIRTRVALGQLDGLRLDEPETVVRLPMAGPALAASLRTLAGRLDAGAGERTPAGLEASLTRAVILAALRDPVGAEAEASRAIALAPLSARVYLVRARVRRHLGRLDEARDDAAYGLKLSPDEPRLWELLGELKAATGDLCGGLADLDRAINLGAEATAHGPKAATLLALGEAEQAARNWTLALKYDPEDPRAFLGRARALIAIGQWDLARADLEQAAAWNDDWSGLGPAIVLAYARCLPARPEQLPRVLALTRRVWPATLDLPPDREPR